MKRPLIPLFGLLLAACSAAHPRGVSPYLPLNLDPDTERAIERVLILANKPILTRPIAAATVLDALPAACKRDLPLCEQVRRYMSRYMRNWGATDLILEGSSSGGATEPLANRYGLTTTSDWAVAARGFWQPNDYALLSLGAVAYEGEVVPEGSMISLGFDRAQLDLGYRSHWLSPLTSSSMLLSTEAATMPSVTLSNYVPLTRWGIHYEAFVASMSRSDHISFGDGFTEGRPRLAGVHLAIEPAEGWSIGFNRLLQYGGGARPGSFKDLLHAFFNPSGYDNVNADLTSDQQVGNQVASITTRLLVPTRVPFAVYFEYAGEDTSAGKNYLLGNAALSAGIDFPNLPHDLDLTYEISEWQDEWYINGVYGDGLTNKGHVVGHWAGDDRLFRDAVGGRSQVLRVGWQPPFGGRLEARLRTLDNENYGQGHYMSAYDGSLRYSRPLKWVTVGAEVFGGRDVYGESFSRVAAFFRYDPQAGTASPAIAGDALAESGDPNTHLFVDVGAASNSVRIDPDATTITTRSNVGGHFAVGARRTVSERSDLGARIELDDVDSHTLLSVRAIDYRYRFRNPLALGVFVGASRYDLATPAYGLYFGAGLQWRNIFPGWDVNADVRTAKKVARDHLLPQDPGNEIRPDSFYTVSSVSLYFTKSF